MLLTLDVITPIVDDPGSFGRIAAANALSDIYAMGGIPELALSFLGVPDVVSKVVVGEILLGMQSKCAEAECAVVGGHTMRDSEPKLGLAVIGQVDPAKAWTHRGAIPGQKLVLTKPLGTGVLAQALRAGAATPEHMQTAVRSMERLNRKAKELGRQHEASAATDVTGFGLLGHLHHLAHASGLQAKLHANRVPLLPGAHQAASDGHVPGGSKKNLAYVERHLSLSAELESSLPFLLADAQTSGGLLLSVDPERAADLATECGGAVVGTLEDGPPGRIEVLP